MGISWFYLLFVPEGSAGQDTNPAVFIVAFVFWNATTILFLDSGNALL